MPKFFATLMVLASGLLTACSHVTSVSSGHSGMVCIAPNVYVDPEMTPEQRQQFLQTLQRSQSQISSFFGSMESTPDVYACTTQSCFKKFGGINARAKTIDDDTVILSSRGLDQVTLVHELVHVEFHKRLGYPHVWNKVPMWFDEGLAVMACKDPRANKVTESIPLKKLESQQQWLDAIRNNKPAYSVAKHAVEVWYKQAGHKGLQQLIQHLKEGKEFSLENTSDREKRITRL